MDRNSSLALKKNQVSVKPQETDFEAHNPCFKEYELSLTCLDKFNYDRSKCQDRVQNYKNCKTFWYQVYNDRRRRGIVPYLPEPEDRDKVKEEYLMRIRR